MTIPANAIVDKLRGGSMGLYEVTVVSLPPHAHTRTYQIEATSDNIAAWEGLRRFGDEMEALLEWSGE